MVPPGDSGDSADADGGTGGGGPAQIGRYRVVRRLGSGAFATVWLVHDPKFDIDVAIKVLADNWVADEAIRERFLTEARILRRIRDRRVVHVYDIDTLGDGRPYFVMDYLEAGTLDDLRRAGLAPAEALRLCAEAAHGLEIVHRHHLVHRDVTPRNLLLTRRPDGSTAVVVADLGVARSVVDSSAGAMAVGTPSYMAPEQAGSGTVDHRADVYALCAVAYALLTGEPPFRVTSMADLTARPAGLAPRPVAERLGAPPTLDGLFVSGLAADPRRRPPSAAALADAFDRVADELAARSWRTIERGEALPPAIGRDAAPSVIPVPAPPTAPVAPAQPPARQGYSSAFYIAMTVLAVVVFVLFLAIVIATSG